MISAEPLPPGTIYAASVSGDGTVGLYRIELSISPGTGKLKAAGGLSGSIKESINRAFSYLKSQKNAFGIASEFDTSDFHVEAIDLLGNKVEAEVGVAFVVAALHGASDEIQRKVITVFSDKSRSSLAIAMRRSRADKKTINEARRRVVAKFQRLSRMGRVNLDNFKDS